MNKNKEKYIYINDRDTDGAVFQTQVIDWLETYQKESLEFEIVQIIHIKKLFDINFIKQQLKFKRSTSINFGGVLFFFPSKGYLFWLNLCILVLKYLPDLVSNKKIVIFSRSLIGNEIKFLKKIFKGKIKFIFDARAAAAEENKYGALKHNDFCLNRYKLIAKIYYLEYVTLITADKIFAVSHELKNYFMLTFKIDESKFVYYPCLSNESKFFYDAKLYTSVRKELHISNETVVFTYAGGISADWHMADKMLLMFGEFLKKNNDSLFLFLSNDKIGYEILVRDFPNLKKNIIFLSVKNDEVYKYLNAADFGLLFRENTIMNNVASPTKFAEYMLCGLPVIITEGIGDYSNLTKDMNLGILLTNSEFSSMDTYNFQNFLKGKFDRLKIATLAKNTFTKMSLIIKLKEHLYLS
jgi:glycosyltransferase involved in cell wall biosynthesis